MKRNIPEAFKKRLISSIMPGAGAALLTLCVATTDLEFFTAVKIPTTLDCCDFNTSYTFAMASPRKPNNRS